MPLDTPRAERMNVQYVSTITATIFQMTDLQLKGGSSALMRAAASGYMKTAHLKIKMANILDIMMIMRK